MNEQDYVAIFARSLKEWRLRKGFTTYDFPDYVGIGRQSLLNYEKGLRMPGLYIAVKMAETLDITLDELVFGEKTAECRN